MRGDHGRRLAACLLVLLLAWVAPAAAADLLAEADAAFDAGEHARALELYDRVLDEDPEQVHALVRSGMLLSWERRFDEAIDRYDRALDLEPANRTAALERAKVLSWSRRFGESREAFRQLLREDAGSRDARIGLARALSWGGNQAAAREEYTRILDEDPEDAEARVGLAQTYQWTGRTGPARDEYERALRARPGMKEARTGLAWLDLADGDREAARAAADSLAAENPDDPDVAALVRAVRRAGAPWVAVSYDRIDDTDDNAIDLWRAEGGWGLPHNLDLTVGAARWDLSSPGPAPGDTDLDASVDSLYGVLGWRVSRAHRLTARAGTDRLEGSDGSSDSEAVGGLTWNWRHGSGWAGRVEYARDPYRYSPPIVDNRILIDQWIASADGMAGGRVRLEGTASYWDLSDGNARRGLEAGAWYVWPLRAPRLETGYVFRYLDFREDTDNGYFDPSDFTAHVAQVRVSGEIGDRPVTYGVIVEAGVQSFTRDGVEVSNDSVLGFTGTLGVPFGERWLLEVYASRNDYAVQSATGFRVRQLGARLRFTFGGGR